MKLLPIISLEKFHKDAKKIMVRCIPTMLKLFPDAVETFAYVTKANRYEFDIKKTQANDAFVIAEGSNVKSMKKIKVISHQKGAIYA